MTVFNSADYYTPVELRDGVVSDRTDLRIVQVPSLISPVVADLEEVAGDVGMNFVTGSVSSPEGLNHLNVKLPALVAVVVSSNVSPDFSNS